MEEGHMKTASLPALLVLGIGVLLAPSRAGMSAPQHTSAAVDIGSNDIGGVVTSAKGPEAGVWVIAETTDLPTKFTKIVITDDYGRYILPDLPQAAYNVWVRRLRAGGLAESHSDAGQDHGPEGGGGAQPARGGAVLPGRLLVFLDPRTG